MSDAEAGGEQWDVVGSDDFGEGELEALESLHRGRNRQLRADDEKLLSTQPCHHVGVAHVGHQHGGERLQGTIANLVAKPIIDRLESIQVRQDHDERHPLAEQLANLHLDHPSVDQPGEAIGTRLLSGDLQRSKRADVGGSLIGQIDELVPGAAVGRETVGGGHVDHAQAHRVEGHGHAHRRNRSARPSPQHRATVHRLRTVEHHGVAAA